VRIRRERVQASGMWSGDQPTCKAATGQTTYLLNCDVYGAVYGSYGTIRSVQDPHGSLDWIRIN
jgi:hypothetical protein